MIRALLEIIKHSQTLSGGNSGACREKFGKAVLHPPSSLQNQGREGRGKVEGGLCSDTQFSFVGDGDDNSKELCA